jgi:hypothetical protein
MEGRGVEEAVNILLLPVEDTLVSTEEDGNKKVNYCIANFVLGIFSVFAFCPSGI